jgi:cell division protein FtsL
MKAKKVGRWIFLAALVILLLLLVSSNVTLYRVYRKTGQLHARVAELNRSVDSLTKEAAMLRSDTAYIERIAREKLGMARKDEKVYKFVEKEDR